MEYMKIPRPISDNVVCDDCKRQLMVVNDGYLVIPSEWIELPCNTEKKASLIKLARSMNRDLIHDMTGPFILCSRCARKYRPPIDMETAKQDLNHWIRTGEVLLRANVGPKRKNHEMVAGFSEPSKHKALTENFSQLDEGTVFVKGNEQADWSTIILCHECGAGNPSNATECVRCNKKLSISKQHATYRLVTPSEIDKIINHKNLTMATSYKLSLSGFFRWLLLSFYLICFGLIVILVSVAIIILIIKYINLIAGIAVGVVALGLVSFLGYYLEITRDERKEKYEKHLKRKKQIQLNRNIDNVIRVIKKHIEERTPLENILPSIRIKDYEVLAKAISSMNFIEDMEKGCLFKKASADFISNAMNYFSDAEKIIVLKQLEVKKRDDVLMRFSLQKRSHLKSQL